MRPERNSQRLLSITRSKAKMFEYDVPEGYHIQITRHPASLFPLAIGLLGDLAAYTSSQDASENRQSELIENLQFSAQFFDNYLLANFQEEHNPYLWLLGSASYYLRNLPGSSSVLAERLGETCPDLGCMGMENLLLWLLQGNFSKPFDGLSGPYGSHIDGISRWIVHYFTNGSSQREFFEHAYSLRKIAYDIGTPRQLLFADLICAVVKKRFENATWNCLPRYSDLSVNQWQPVLQKDTFIRELWPSQHLLGEHGVFKGKSAVAQMPTSAGKTKATEIIIRSAFLAGRTNLAIIVAPFRALCHEIRNDLVEAFRNEAINVSELSDIFRVDFDLTMLLKKQQILIVTPEKLVYALRYIPELAKHIGLLIYDEGHQFDNGTRGITYELLLTSLKMMVPKEVQAVLISAVISNAKAVGEWLNGKDAEVVSGTNLVPTYRTTAFASWLDQLGRLEFVAEENPDIQEFFVPRIIEQQQLQLRGKESKQRVFPEKTDGQSVALYLGLKVVCKGSVAIFCGRKSTVSGLCEKIVDKYSRGLSFKKPIDFSNENEVRRLHFLYESNLGSDAEATKSAALGIFAHHANIPQGIRLAVEHAMKEGLAKCVICTSTLAQGVNLPIRYLIVTSVYQGEEQIKVRDFKNLVGRAGRAGIYTEGSILFADPKVYDTRSSQKYNDRRRWQQVKELFKPSNSEPCTSRLASILIPLSINRKHKIRVDPLDFVRAYVNDDDESLVQKIISEHISHKLEDRKRAEQIAKIKEQVTSKLTVFPVIESFLMAHWDDSDSESHEKRAVELAGETLAYSMAGDEQRTQIVKIFRLLAQNIAGRVTDVARRKVFGKTLYGVQNITVIEEWVKQHLESLLSCNTHDELLMALWSLLSRNIQNNTFKKFTPEGLLPELALGWIQGKSLGDLFQLLKPRGVRIGTGERLYHLKIDHVVDICENGLAYHGTLLLSAVAEIVKMIRPNDNENLIRNLQELQQRLRYGLSSFSAIILYELGFADRVVSIQLSSIIGSDVSNREFMTQSIRSNEREMRAALEKYPQYFTQVLNEVL